MEDFKRDDINSIASKLGLDIPKNWSGIDAVLPLLERMRQEGSVIVVKLDGGRTEPDDTGPYTVVGIQGLLGDELIRTDSENLEDALCYLIGSYAKLVWKRT